MRWRVEKGDVLGWNPSNQKQWVRGQHQHKLDPETRTQVHKYKQMEATWKSIIVAVNDNQRQVNMVTRSRRNHSVFFIHNARILTKRHQRSVLSWIWEVIKWGKGSF